MPTYAAETSPLAIIDSFAGFHHRALPTVLRRWLSSELKKAQYARLEQAGHPDAAPLELPKVFTDIEAGAQPWHGGDNQENDPSMRLRPGIVAELMQTRPGPCTLKAQEPSPHGLAEESGQNGFLLIGGPGQGKSTVGQYLCQLHRAAILGAAGEQAAAPDKRMVEMIDRSRRAQHIPPPTQVCLPAHIDLPALAAWMNAHNVAPKRAVIGFLCRRIAQEAAQAEQAGQTDIPDVDVESLLGQVPWLFVFDGLDEIPTSGGKAYVVEAVEEFLRLLQQRQTEVLVLVTTRPQGYRDEFSATLVPRYLYPLSRARALHYARRLVQTRYRTQPDRRQKIMQRLEQASEEEASRRLLTTPLQVTIMAALVDRIGRPPHQRWRLFGDYYRVIYEREIERPHSSAASLMRDHRTHIEAIHRQAGLIIQVASEQYQQSRAVLTGAQLSQLILRRLEDEGFSEPKRRELAARIREVATERLVFLVGLEEDGYGFELRSLQEFMAAEALMEGKDDDVVARLGKIVGLASWSNVFLFAVGKCFSERTHLRDAVVGLCRAIASPADDGAGLGAYMALAILEDRAVESPRHVRELAQLAAELMDLPAHEEIQPRLARVDEAAALEVFEAVLRDDDGWPQGPLAQLGRWLLLAELADAGYAWAREITDARWPTTTEDRQLVIRAVDHSSDLIPLWLGEQIANHLSDVPLPYMESLRDRRWLSDPSVSVPHLSFMGLDYHRWMPAGILALLPDEDPDRRPFAQDSVVTAMDRAQDENKVPRAWEPWFSARKFHQHPNKYTLANELERLAQYFDRDTFRWWSMVLPWPLGGSLAGCDSSEAMKELAAELRAGDHGDIANWRIMETQWRALPFIERVELPQLVSVLGLLGTESWPYLSRIIAFLDAMPDEQEPSELFEVYQATTEPALRRMLARWLVSVLESRAGSGRMKRFEHFGEALTPKGVELLYKDKGVSPNWPGVGISLIAFSPESKRGQWLDAMESWYSRTPDKATAVERCRFVFTHNFDFLDYLSAEYTKNPKHVFSLHMLARLVISGARIEIAPEFLDPQRFTQEAERMSARLITWSSDDTVGEAIESWLQQRIASGDRFDESLYKWQYSGLLQVVHRHIDEPPDVRLRCKQLLREYIPDRYWDIHAALHLTMLGELDNRHSHLDRAAVWFQLGLEAPAAEAILGPSSHGHGHAATATRSAASDHADADDAPEIDHISIRHVRVFDSLDIQFTSDNEHPQQGRWLVLLGENGVGKSTLLRSLALALAEPELAQSLAVNAKAPMVRSGASEADIQVHVRGVPFAARILVEDGDERLHTGKNGAPRPMLFAYGCARGSAIGGPAREVSYAAIGQLLTLFDESEPLISAETWLKLLQLDALKHGGRHRDLFDSVQATLCGLLPGIDDLDVDGHGVHFSGPAVGTHTPLAGLSDGYLTTLGWACDLLARWLHRAQRRGDPIAAGFNQHMRGLVLIDEIDLHLHPRWQRQVIAIVRAAFPRMSFVVTTHNPLTLLGARDGEVVVLKRTPDRAHTATAVAMDVPKGIRADQVLTGEWFGLASTRDPDTVTLLEKHRQFLRDDIPSSNPERQQVEAELKRRLDGFPGTSIEELSRQVAAEVLDETYPQRTTQEKAELRDLFKKRLAERQRQRDTP